MRRITWIIAIVTCIALVLAGCGKKDAGSVVKDLDHVINKLESYQSVGKMVLQTGQQPQEYHVEVWHQKPHYYRISLTDSARDITQIVLRNDEGVFVLTPHLNKSFRFQSNWPENQGQVYLYQSLIHSVLADEDRLLVQQDGAYVFDVLANYQNASLARQKIWLDAKTYAPKRVEVSDANGHVLVTMEFTQFQFGVKFEKDAFDMQRNMTSSQFQSLPTMAQTNEGNTQGESSSQNESQTQAQSQFGVIQPSYTPEGVKLKDMQEVKLGQDQAIMLRYFGEYNYTLVESRPTEKSVSFLPGSIIDLGFTLGVVTGDDLQTLTWTSEGVEFRLSTGDLPQTEMIKVAQSVQSAMGK